MAQSAIAKPASSLRFGRLLPKCIKEWLFATLFQKLEKYQAAHRLLLALQALISGIIFSKDHAVWDERE